MSSNQAQFIVETMKRLHQQNDLSMRGNAETARIADSIGTEEKIFVGKVYILLLCHLATYL